MFKLVQISTDVFNQIIEYCSEKLPNEACGAFLGIHKPDYILILDFRPIPNVSPNPNNHFEFDRNALLDLLYPKQDLTWIGIFHSHPLSAAYPSEEDLRNPWQLPVYAIISFANLSHPTIRSFRIDSKQQKKPYSIKEQTLHIITN